MKYLNQIDIIWIEILILSIEAYICIHQKLEIIVKIVGIPDMRTTIKKEENR